MFRAEVWIATILIIAGVTGAVVYNLPSSEAPEPAADETAAVAKTNADSDAGKGKPSMGQLASIEAFSEEAGPMIVELATDQIDRGDQYFLAGNFTGAQRAYLKAANRYQGNPPTALLFRLAMSAEQLKDIEGADALYQKTVRRSADGSSIRLMSLTGVARVWQASGQLPQAQQLLAELFLRYASNPQVHDEIRQQITYQLTAIAQQLALKQIFNPQTVMEEVEFKWCEPSIDAMLDITKLEQETGVNPTPSRRDRNAQPEWRVLQRPTANLNQIAVDTSVPLTAVTSILTEYANRADIELELNPATERSLAGRSARLAVTGMSLALVFDQLLSPLGLSWSQTGKRVVVKPIDQNDNQQGQYLTAQAQRLLRRIELSFPRGPRRDSSLLHQGNLSLISEDFVSAENRYLELEKLTPTDELSAKLSFNIGLFNLANDNSEEAINRLFFSVDQSLNQALQSKCYAWISRLELQSGRADRAVYAASRGLSLAEDAQVRQEALMNLAKAYLLESDPFSANRVLFNNTDSVVDPAEQRLAAVLSAYARFLGMVPSAGLRNEGERMVVALAAIETEDLSEFVDQLLVGRAFYEVGFATRSNALLQQALDQAPHASWRRRVAFELANNQLRAGDLDAAEESFSNVVTETADQVTLKSLLQLAGIALDKKQPQRCLEVCKRLYRQELSDEQRQQMLSMMGTSFRLLERHELAAICFSGSVPQNFGSDGESPATLQLAPDADSNLELINSN